MDVSHSCIAVPWSGLFPICSVGSRKYASITITQVSSNLCTDLPQIIMLKSDDSVK